MRHDINQTGHCCWNESHRLSSLFLSSHGSMSSEEVSQHLVWLTRNLPVPNCSSSAALLAMYSSDVALSSLSSSLLCRCMFSIFRTIRVCDVAVQSHYLARRPAKGRPARGGASRIALYCRYVGMNARSQVGTMRVRNHFGSSALSPFFPALCNLAFVYSQNSPPAIPPHISPNRRPSGRPSYTASV